LRDDIVDGWLELKSLVLPKEVVPPSIGARAA